MQRHLKPAARQFNLSIEEEAILTDEQNQVTLELKSLETDLDRVEDTQNIITDVQSVLAQTPEIGGVEQELVAAAADMATAGTDANPEDILPATPEGIAIESFTNTAMEKIKAIWEKIKEYIQKIWQAIKDFFSKLGKFFSRTEKRQEHLKEMLQEEKHPTSSHSISSKETDNSKSSETKEETKPQPAESKQPFVFVGNQTALRVGTDGKLLSPKEFVDGLRHITDISKDVANVVTARTAQQFEMLEKIGSDLYSDSSNFDSICKKALEEIKASRQKMIHDIGVDAHTGRHKLKNLPADFTITATSLAGSEESVNIQVLKVDVEVGFWKYEEIETKALDARECETILGIATAWKENVTRFEQQALIKEAEAAYEKAKLMNDKLSNEAPKLFRDGKYNKDAFKDMDHTLNVVGIRNYIMIFGNGLRALNRQMLMSTVSVINETNQIIDEALKYAEQSTQYRMKNQ